MATGAAHQNWRSTRPREACGVDQELGLPVVEFGRMRGGDPSSEHREVVNLIPDPIRVTNHQHLFSGSELLKVCSEGDHALREGPEKVVHTSLLRIHQQRGDGHGCKVDVRIRMEYPASLEVI